MAQVAGPMTSSPQPPGKARPVTLLIVDDEPAILKALQRIVRDEGYRVFTALDAEEALRLVASESVDVVLSDMDMPGMSGLDLMVRLRRNHASVVRLLLTGRGTLAAAVGAINDGEVYRFMTKPWDIDELREVLRQAATRAMKNRATAQANEQGTGDRTTRLGALEREHPGITAVNLTRGIYLVEPSRLRSTLTALQSPALSRCWPPEEP
jgi:two-component system probable response regulator PhcQ